MGNDVDGMGRSAQMAAERDPERRGYFLLAQAYEAANNIEWAIRHGQRAWALGPDKPEVVVFVGKLYEERGDKRMARELYEMNAIPLMWIYSAFERVGGSDADQAVQSATVMRDQPTSSSAVSIWPSKADS